MKQVKKILANILLFPLAVWTLMVWTVTDWVDGNGKW